MPRITNEIREMYNIYRDIGELDSICEGMTGDYHKDKYLFAECWNKAKKKIKDIDLTDPEIIDTDE